MISTFSPPPLFAPSNSRYLSIFDAIFRTLHNHKATDRRSLHYKFDCQYATCPMHKHRELEGGAVMGYANTTVCAKALSWGRCCSLFFFVTTEWNLYFVKDSTFFRGFRPLLPLTNLKFQSPPWQRIIRNRGVMVRFEEQDNTKRLQLDKCRCQTYFTYKKLKT